ncbi:MAG: 2-phospho-L-lactate guanylyltransferase [Halobacterium sp.]
MRVVVPFDATNPNSRLAPVLSAGERREFAAAMLADVLAAVRGAGGDPVVLAAADDEDWPSGDDGWPTDSEWLSVEDGRLAPSGGEAAPVTVDDRSLSAAVNDALADGLPAAVVMADLALATPDALAALFDADGDVVLAPGRGGGTNAVVVRHPAFRVDYHGVSYRDHVAAADAVGASASTVDSFRLAVDVDERADLLDLLVHGDGRAADWLRDAGFEVVVRGGDPVLEPNA